MDINFVRRQFPALEQDFTYMDNAGGSQTLAKVAERISGYLLHHNVQLGALRVGILLGRGGLT